MGTKDLAIRLLAEHCLADIAPALLPQHEIVVERVVAPQLKLVERIADTIALITIDGAPAVLHVEFEATLRGQGRMPARVMAYNALLRQRYPGRAVVSVVVYLVAKPDSRRPVRRALGPRPGDLPLDFRYHVFLPWENPLTLDDVAKHPGLGPLALLTPGITAADLPAVRQLLEHGNTPGLPVPDLLAVAYIMAAHRFPLGLLDSYLRSEAMESSPGYQSILREGIKKGLEQGLEQGLERGREQGLEQGIERGILRLIELRLGSVPAGFDGYLDSLSLRDLENLQDTLLASQDEEALRAAIRTALG